MIIGHGFARRIFQGAAVYGILVLIPHYFMEKWLAEHFPPPLTHPEHFYGFIGIAIAWQIVFLIVASDVQRYRLLMPVAVLEKLAFGIPAWLLYIQGRAHAVVVVAGTVDLLLAMLFAAAWMLTRNPFHSDVAAPGGARTEGSVGGDVDPRS